MPWARGTSCAWPEQLQVILEMMVLVTFGCLTPAPNQSDTGSWIPLVTQDFDPVSTHSDGQRYF